MATHSAVSASQHILDRPVMELVGSSVEIICASDWQMSHIGLASIN